jgi:hypothetical protein
MKPGGAMYPSHARIFLAPIATESGLRRNTDFQGSMEGWAEFQQEMANYYQVDVSVLSEPFRREQREYYLQTSQVGEGGFAVCCVWLAHMFLLCCVVSSNTPTTTTTQITTNNNTPHNTQQITTNQNKVGRRAPEPAARPRDRVCLVRPQHGDLGRAQGRHHGQL